MNDALDFKDKLICTSGEGTKKPLGVAENPFPELPFLVVKRE